MSRRVLLVYAFVVTVLLALSMWSNRTTPTEIANQYAEQVGIHTNNYRNIRSLGKEIWQPPLDLWTLQETIYDVKPHLLIECGTYRGGSSYFFAQLFDLMGEGRVITVDIVKQHNLSHPRVTYLLGQCASPAIVEQITAEAKRVTGPIFVVLDSDHSAANVLREMQAYGPLVTPESYMMVQDGSIDLSGCCGPGPLTAINQFLEGRNDFVVDR